MGFDVTRPRLEYTRPSPGPNPSTTEGVGDPSGPRFGGHFSLWADPFALNEIWVYQDGKSPEVTYSTGHIIANGRTTGRSWEKETRSVDSIVDDTLAAFEKQWLSSYSPSTPDALCAATRPASRQWQRTLVTP